MMTFGFSPCPNDTYIFYALANNKIDLRGLEFDFTIEDIETLNQLAFEKKLAISKVSSYAYFHLRKDYIFLKSGAAFGRGCGPLIVAKEDFTIKERGRFRIGIPGRLTTAFLLLKLYFSVVFKSQLSNLDYIFMPFNEIMGAVKKGFIDAGLVIHEGRFIFAQYGLVKIVDLGEWWEAETDLPIPLGGIIARREIAPDTIKIIEDLIVKSVKYSGNHFDETLGFIKQHSQELEDSVIRQHISLYVNDYTMGIGDKGEKALKELFARAERFNV